VIVVVGLGNPGTEYAGTRHNAGWEVVDRLAARAGAELRRDRMLNALACRAGVGGKDALLVQPLSYMNLSGDVAARALARADGAPADLMVVCDDFHLPLGTIRVRGGGTAGGHNGLKDVERALGTREYPRLRIGVGAPTTQDSADFVLARFRPAERPAAEESMDRAADAVEAWAEHGLEWTMARWNGGPPGAPGRDRA
jgi:PTH1 family peptidyl-tRNA hydrolase